MTTEPPQEQSNIERFINETMLDIQGTLAAHRGNKRRLEEDEDDEQRIAAQLKAEDEPSALEEYHSQSLALL
jgi:hypothetical protein